MRLQSTIPATVSLLAAIYLLSILILPTSSHAGWIEDCTGKTIIHLNVPALPQKARPTAYDRAQLASIKEFGKRFPEIFASKYSEQYKAHPEIYGIHNWNDVSIELHQSTGIKVEGVESDLLAIAGGVAPDVIQVNFRQSASYIGQGVLHPLDRQEDHYLSELTNTELDFRINPKLWPVIKRKGSDGISHTWVVPDGGALGKVIVYRKDLFEEFGVDHPKNNWTWSDLLEKSRKLTDPARGIYGFQLGMSKHESYNWMPFLWSAGGDCMIYDDTSDKWLCVFDTKEAAIALDFFLRLRAEPWIDKNGTPRYGYAYKMQSGESGIKWLRGEIAMKFDYINEKLLTEINPDLIGMVPVPIGPTGMRGSELNSRMLGIFGGIKDIAVRDAAWEYIKFSGSSNAAEIQTKVMVEGGFGKFINPEYLQMFGYQDLLNLAPPEWAECFKTAIDIGRPEPYGKNSNYAYDMMTAPIFEAEELALKGNLPADTNQRQLLLQSILHKAVVRANEEMLGIIRPGEMAIRRLTAAGFLTLIVVAFTIGLIKISHSFSPPPIKGVNSHKWGFKRFRFAYLLLLPAVLSMVLWRYYPLLRGSIMAFQDYGIMGKSYWAGLDNFGNILWDQSWWIAIWNSLRYSFLVISLTFLPPVILAIFLQETPIGKIMFRIIFYLPAVVTSLVTILLWRTFYEGSEYGFLNTIVMKIPAIAFILAGVILMLFMFAFSNRLRIHGNIPVSTLFAIAGLVLLYTSFSLAEPILQIPGHTVFQKLFLTSPEPRRWLENSDTAMFCCVLPMIWAGMGPGCLIYLAALKGIPDDFYEAADVDGATFIDKILFIVFPILKPLLIINFVGVFINSWFGATANIMAMTGGGANTEVAGLHIFYKAFIYMKFGPATAMAWMLGFMLIGFTVYQLKILSKLEFKTTGAEPGRR